METFESLVRAEFAPKNTYLNTASTGLLPTRTVTAMHTAIEAAAVGTADRHVRRRRGVTRRLRTADGVPVDRVAAGASVAVYSGLIAASLPAGAEVLTAEADFSSVVNPFHMRADLKVRSVPLERIAESVRPGTALVAVSAAQSADGRIADLPARPGGGTRTRGAYVHRRVAGRRLDGPRRGRLRLCRRRRLQVARSAREAWPSSSYRRTSAD
jgi:selenocysteine lyase/cysteine desulfurase